MSFFQKKIRKRKRKAEKITEILNSSKIESYIVNLIKNKATDKSFNPQIMYDLLKMPKGDKRRIKLREIKRKNYFNKLGELININFEKSPLLDGKLSFVETVRKFFPGDIKIINFAKEIKAEFVRNNKKSTEKSSQALNKFSKENKRIGLEESFLKSEWGSYESIEHGINLILLLGGETPGKRYSDIKKDIKIANAFKKKKEKKQKKIA